MWPFKKKQEPIVESPKPRRYKDLGKYKIELNFKTLMTYEQLSGKSFLAIENEEDLLKLYYCALMVNNEEFKNLTFKTFEYMAVDEVTMRWMGNEYKKITKYLAQFQHESDNKENSNGSDEPFKITDAIATLIVRMKIDAHYVLYEMQLWEMEKYFKAYQGQIEEHYEEERMWTYLTIMPHIDTKKCKSPEKMMPLPWEKGKKKSKAEKQMERDKVAIKANIGMSIDDLLGRNKKKEENKDNEE